MSAEVAHTARRGWALASELGLVALALGTLGSFNRLFIGWGFFSRLLPAVVLGWLSAAALRRLRVRVGVALMVHLVLGILLLTMQFAPGTHLLGIPSSHSLQTFGNSIDTSFAQFSELVAPVPVSDGFLVVIAACMWVFAFFADTAALRYRGSIQAAVPYLAVFLTLGVLARSSGRTTAVVLFGLGTVVYATTLRGRFALEQRWVGGHARRGARSLASQAAGVTATALLLGILLSPLLPGGDEPVIDLRELGRGDGPRTVVSPFVGIRSLLGPRSDDVVFTVEANAPAYWRLTALEQFDADRHIWVSSGTYSSVQDRLPGSMASTAFGGTELRQDFEVTGLGGLWLPGAYVPRRIDSDRGVSYDAESASVILRDETGADETVSYRLESLVPDFAFVTGAPSSMPDLGDTRGVEPEHLEVPDLGPVVRDSLALATSGAASDYDRMLALQNWFRAGFSYDESVDYSAEGDPLQAFLEQRRGFCQQFSSAFALMARSVGLPSRVAVGFTPGDPVPEEDGGTADGTTRFEVRGRHAHAWPEVHLAGVGWVPFEPTPQRGDPQSVGHTGVAPDQAAPPEAGPTSTTADPGGTTPTTAPEDGPTTTVATGDESPAPATPPDGARDRGRGVSLPLLVGLGLVGALAVGAVRIIRRRAKSDTAWGPRRAAVATAWQDVAGALRRIGLPLQASETPLEFASRVTATLELSDDAAAGDICAAVQRLAVIETRARYGDGDPSPQESGAAEEAARVVKGRVAQLSSSERRNLSRARVPAPLK